MRKLRIIRVPNQDHWCIAAQSAVGVNIFVPHLLESFVYAGQFVMGIEIRLAQAGKVFDGSDDASCLQSFYELSCINDNLPRIGRNSARTHNGPGCFKSQIYYRSKIRIKAERAATMPDEIAMLAEQDAAPGGKYVCGGRCPAEHFAETIHPPTFKINAGQ